MRRMSPQNGTVAFQFVSCVFFLGQILRNVFILLNWHPDSDHGYSTMTPLGTTHGPGTDLESELGVSASGVTPYVRSAPARERYARKQQQGRCSVYAHEIHNFDVRCYNI